MALVPETQMVEAGVSAPVPTQKTFLAGTLQRRAIQLLVILVPLIILLLFIVYPLASIILQSIFPNLFALQPNFAISLDTFDQLVKQAENYSAFVNSLWLGATTAIVACALGTVLAFLSRRTDLPLRRFIDPLVWIVFFTPSFLVGEAWSLMFTRGSVLDYYFHFSNTFIHGFYSPIGVIFILVLKTFPFAYLSVTAALRWLGSEFEDAARINGANVWYAWMRINIPLLFPAILAGGLIVFAEAIADFGISATIAQSSSIPMVTFAIYGAINTLPVNFSLAAALSLLLFLLIALALLTQSAILHRGSFQVLSGKSRPMRNLSLGLWKWPALVFTCLVFVLALLVPLGVCLILSLLHASGQGLVASNWTLSNYQAALIQGSDDLAALQQTLELSLANATITTLVGLPLAFIIRRSSIPGRRLLNFFTTITIAVPGIILACGYIFAWNAPYLSFIGIGGPNGIPFYGTIWILLAAWIGSSLPYATRLNISAIDQISPTIVETAQVQGANLLQLFIRIIGPLVRSNLASVWLLVFTGSMFELAVSQLLYPAGKPTMSVQIMALVDNTQIGPGMALAMLNIALVILALAIIRGLAWLLHHYGQRRQSAE